MSHEPTTDRATRSFNLSSDGKVLTKWSIIVGLIAFVSVASVMGYQIKANGEQALSEIKAMREEAKPYQDKTNKLWWEYERAMAKNGGSVGGP